MGFRSLTEAIDTTTPGGRLVFHLFAALGSFERGLIRECARASRTTAAARGRTGGRRQVTMEEKLRRAQALIAEGLGLRCAAVHLRAGKTALYDAHKPLAT